MYDGKHFIRAGEDHFTPANDKNWRAEADSGLYATTTLMDEFLDSALVIRGTVIAAYDGPPPANAQNNDADPYSIYHIRIEQVFKGKASSQVQDFTKHDSGGFYMNTGKEYLLFLNPMTKDDDARKIAPGAMRVNYSCGQSQPWANLSAKDRIALQSLAAGKP